MTETKRTIYMDHAATTPVDPRVVEAMLPYFNTHFGNPSSIYALGREAAEAVDQARQTIADVLHAQPRDIIFTSGGSEADNLAVRGSAFAQRKKGKNHIITSPIEHHAVGHTIEQLVKEFGFESTVLSVDRYGVVDPAELERAITDKTALVTIMYANNEVGTIQPIQELAAVAKARGVLFHTDAVQAAGSLDLDVDKLGIDMLALSAHKFYGPKGVGLLYVRRYTPLLATQTGGGHERNRRAGTENVPYLVGMATALRLAYEEREQNNAHARELRDRLVEGILQSIPDTELTGHLVQRLPNNASFVFHGIEGESILLNLDLLGVAASSGSACTSASLEPSHVLRSMQIPVEICHGSLRLTLGRDNTAEDVDYVVAKLPAIVAKLRAMSPVYHK
jgi:cysteine desulfurase